MNYLHNNVIKVAISAGVAGLVAVLIAYFLPGQEGVATSPSPPTQAPAIPGGDYNGLRSGYLRASATRSSFPGIKGSSDGPAGSSCSSEEYHEWAGQRGGVTARAINKFLGVEAPNSNVAAVVLGINVRVLSRRPPVAGLLAACPTGDRITYTATIDLDQPSPTVSFGNEEEKGGPRDRLQFAMHQGDVLDIYLTAKASRQTVTFAADLVVLINDKRTLIPIGH